MSVCTSACISFCLLMGIFVSLQTTSANNAVAAKDAFEPQFFLHTPSGLVLMALGVRLLDTACSFQCQALFQSSFHHVLAAFCNTSFRITCGCGACDYLPRTAYFPEEIESCIRALPQSSGIASGEISGIRRSCSSSIHLLCCRLAQHIPQVLCTASKRSRSRRANHH